MRWFAVLVMSVLVGGAPAYADPPGGDVVGGVRAQPAAYPWMVKLSVGCGGALVRPTVVLTAAHCVGRTGRTTRIVATAGSVDLSAPTATRVRSTSVRTATDGGDWALVELERAVDLPLLALSMTPQYDSGRFTILGWGAASEGGNGRLQHLRTAQVSFVDDRTCGRAYSGAGFDFVAESMICAAAPGKDTCQGDSGGPMVRPDATGRYVQVGIVSWGYGCARDGYPGVYTQVSRFAADISAALAAH